MEKNITPRGEAPSGSVPAKKADDKSKPPVLIDAATGEVQKVPKAELIPLTKAQAEELKECEDTIRKGWDTFVEVGRALATIREDRLYKDKYAEFEEYCRAEWGFSKTHVNRQIAASHVVDVLTPIGVKIENESVARPMTGLTDDQIRKTYETAQKLAEKEKKTITAAIVKKAAVKFKPAKPAGKGKSRAKKATGGKSINLGPALKLLARAVKVAEQNKDQLVLKELAALQECLEALAGK
ncbi:MAG: hypothetical protein ABSA47_13580 [Verrucomicrobiota bacterium]|jgi:hypothetical protein